MREREFDAILFDMDGTLVDSEELHTLAWVKLLESFGHAPPAADWADSFMGEPDSQSLRNIVAMFPDLADKGDILEVKQRIFRDLVAERGGAIAMPGVHTPLRQLAAAGYPMAVGTNGVLANCRAVLKAAGLLHYFATLATFDQVKNGKPAPDIYRAAAKRLGFPPERCIVVEDSDTGAKSGKAAGCFVVGVASSHPPQRLETADAVLSDTEAALDWIVDRLASAAR